MKISGEFSVPELQPELTRTGRIDETAAPSPPGTAPPAASGRADSVELSAEAQELVRMKEQMGSVTESRSERLEEIRRAVAQGRLAEPDQVADSLLRTLDQEGKI